MNIKRTAPDIVFSNLVRERAEWTCERQSCSKYFPEGHRAGLECSHFYTRSRKSVRWSPLNACAQCTGCHSHLGGNPMEFADWIREYLGPEKSAALIVQNRIIMHLKRHDKREILANLKASLEHMQSCRRAGEVGRLEFSDPYPDHLLT